ncbi:MAG: hypothetical protein R3264_18345 [Anaerolineae bacterium]|nr:hypothetical protein [Anaerolineae bacterium]
MKLLAVFKILAIAILALPIALTTQGRAQPIPTGPMTISVNPTQITPDQSADVTATLTGVININCGTTTIQYRIYDDAGKTTIRVDWTPLNSGTPVNSVYTTTFDGTAIPVSVGELVSFRAAFNTAGCPGGMYQGTNFGNSPTADLLIIASDDPFPDGTITYTQGFYGSSPMGEATVSMLIDEATCNEINDILTNIGRGLAIDCSLEADRNALAFFLTGTVGPGGQDGGFLPSGLAPGENLAAQKITLLLNLNLGFILLAPDIPILSTYYLNIDVVQDIVDGVPGDFIDPVFRNPELYDVCVDSEPDQVCDPGFVLSALGTKVADLDDAGTTVEDILIAADSLLASGNPDIDVNGVTLTRDDMTNILGLINESYDEGNINGFVTLFDADPV